MILSSQEQALKLFMEVVQSILDNTSTTPNNLRKLMRACTLLNWEENVKYIRSELMGFSQDQECPWYRQAQHWLKEWHAYNTPMGTLSLLIVKGKIPQSEPLRLDVRHGVTELELPREPSLRYTTNEIQEIQETYNPKETIVFRASQHLPPNTVALILERINDWCFEFASSASVTLEFGNLVDDIYQSYRNIIEKYLTVIGLSKGFKSITENLRSNEPLMWRASVLACRSVLQDIASHLWQDARSTYDQLPG
ncbi:MAG: hypothetical protein EXR50_07725 [Dehalococcoidia bacterium]|nr:hypothetical protein [Dehalococcoidia bacterium]